MDDQLRRGIEVIHSLTLDPRSILSDSDSQFLQSQASSHDDNPQQLERISEIYAEIFAGFFAAAQQGVTFADRDRIKQKFGNTLEGNYPEASATFLRFAYSYWTLKVLNSDLVSHRDTVAGLMIGKLESTIALMFFPIPGPISIPADQREATQRELLSSYCDSIDIEDFFRGNPILIRDRQREAGSGGGGGGCAVALMTLPAALIQSGLSRFGA